MNAKPSGDKDLSNFIFLVTHNFYQMSTRAMPPKKGQAVRCLALLMTYY